MPKGAKMLQLLSISCCTIEVVRIVMMMAISLHLPLWVGIVKLWPGFCHETRPFYAGRFAPDQWLSAKSRPTASRKKGRLVA